MTVRIRPSAPMNNMNKLIIGLVGEKGGGKGSFVASFEKIAKDKKIEKVNFSDVLKETLILWDLPISRQNLTKLSVSMNDVFGPGTLTHVTTKRISNSTADIVFLDGVRWKSDLEFIRGLPNSLLIYITADPKIRFERTRARKEKAGEEKTSFEQFLREEKLQTELLIPEIGKTADFTITNNGTLEEFKNQVKNFYREVQSRF